MKKKLSLIICAAGLTSLACLGIVGGANDIKLSNVGAENETAYLLFDATHNLPTESGVSYRAYTSNGGFTNAVLTIKWDGGYTIGGDSFITGPANASPYNAGIYLEIRQMKGIKKIEWDFEGIFYRDMNLQYYDNTSKKVNDIAVKDLVGSWDRPDDGHEIRYVNMSICSGQDDNPEFVVNYIKVTYDVSVCRG